MRFETEVIGDHEAQSCSLNGCPWEKCYWCGNLLYSKCAEILVAIEIFSFVLFSTYIRRRFHICCRLFILLTDSSSIKSPHHRGFALLSQLS